MAHGRRRLTVTQRDLEVVAGPWLSPAHFAMWATREDPYPWKPYRWLLLLNRYLVEVAAGRIPRFLLEGPIRHGKSYLTAWWFPAWYLCMNPENRVLIAAYNEEFADSWGAKVRAAVHDFGKQVSGVEVSRDTAAKGNWGIEGHRGGLFTCGAGNPPAGRGFELIIIDDPVKDEADAFSPKLRDNTWNWFEGDILRRLNPGGSLLLDMARRHEDDLVGRVKMRAARPEAQPWTTLRLPALAEPTEEEPDPLGRETGEPLCPQLWTKDALEQIRADTTVRFWEAQYQARPSSPEGEMFKVTDWGYVEGIPFDTVEWVRRWDLAATEKHQGNDPDYTAGVLMGRHPSGRIIIADARRDRVNELTVQKMLQATAREDQAKYAYGGSLTSGRVRIIIPQDPGSAGKALVGYYLREVLQGFDVSYEKETGSKMQRAQIFAAQVAAGNVFLLRAPWNEAFVDELRAFPNGAHDDWLDAAAGAFNALMVKPRASTGEADNQTLTGRR